MKIGFFCCVALCICSVSASADSNRSPGWQFKVTPYLWMTGLQGDVGRLPDGSPVDVDLSFQDVLEDLDAAGMIYASATNDPWVSYVDFTHTRSSSTEALGGILLDEANVESETTTLALAVGRAFARTDRMTATAYVGARAWWIDNTFELRGVGGGSSRQSSSESWVDPLVGVTGQFEPTERWTLSGALEVGGFGIGADSEFSALAAATYEVTEWFGISFGWRHLQVDYDSGDTLYDVRQSGPLLGATFVF